MEKIKHLFESFHIPENSQEEYLYPIDCLNPKSIPKENGINTHKGPYKGAIDFIVPVGTRVLASADGFVTKVVNGNQKYGNSPDFSQFANYITIFHPQTKEYSQYIHLSNILIKEGDFVKKGQNISQTGLNGFMDKPHLHFLVFKNSTNKYGFIGLKPKFSK